MKYIYLFYQIKSLAVARTGPPSISSTERPTCTATRAHDKLKPPVPFALAVLYNRCRRRRPPPATATAGRHLHLPRWRQDPCRLRRRGTGLHCPGRDIVLDIFLRLGPREVMLGAEFACKPWRSVALEEPSLWRRVGMENNLDKHWRWRHGSVEMAMKLVGSSPWIAPRDSVKPSKETLMMNICRILWKGTMTTDLNPLFDAVFICIYCKLAN